jgi:hypothetical protein
MLMLAPTLLASPADAELARREIRAIQGVTAACDLTGWSTNQSSEGLEVRDGPSGRSKVIGRIPYDPGKPEEDYRGFGVSFSITGSRNGWLRIRNAGDDFSRSGLKNKSIFAGEGWIFGGHIGFSVQSARVRATAHRNTPVLREIRHPAGQGTEWLTSVATIERVYACRGGWALISYRGKTVWGGQRLTPDTIAPDGIGWVTNICGRQETTCDMPSSD